MDRVMDYIDETLKPKLTDGEYLELTNRLQVLHDTKYEPKYKSWQDIVNVFSENDIADHIPGSADGFLSQIDAENLPYELAKLLNSAHKEICALKGVILNQARRNSELENDVRFYMDLISNADNQ